MLTQIILLDIFVSVSPIIYHVASSLIFKYKSKENKLPTFIQKAKNIICTSCCLINQRRRVNYMKTTYEYFKRSMPNTLCVLLKDLVAPFKL